MSAEEVQIDVEKLNALACFSSFFKQGKIEALAKQSGFVVRRSSRLSGAAFLQMMVQNMVPLANNGV